VISWETLAAFALTALVLIAIPGPSVLFVISRALEHGRRGALITAGANSAGAVIGILVVALGLGSLMATSVAVFTAMKWVGATFLIYLGVKAIRDRRLGIGPTFVAPKAESGFDSTGQRGEAAAPAVATTASPLLLARQGFVVGLLNPKAALAMGAILPQFVDPGRGSPVGQMLLLGLVFVCISLICDGSYAMVASALREWFAKSATRIVRLRAAGGTMMIGLGVAMAAARR
jgi:threonine/homoserine/homoserine lactone efflux protein